MFLSICIGVIVTIFIFSFFAGLALEKKIKYKDLKNKHVVVTGGSSGIGKAIAIEAAKLGANVTIIGRDVEKLNTAIDEILEYSQTTTQKIQFISLDVTSDYNIIAVTLLELEADMGPIFMLVNCAGMCICGEFEKMEVNDIKLMIELNYLGTALPTKYVLPGMKNRNEGILLFVSTEAALIGIYGYSAYGAAKWAVRGLAETISMELLGTNVSLTLAFPPDTDTPGFKKEELTKPLETKLISGSGGLHKPEDVGRKMIMDALNGKTYSVYGFSGYLLYLLNCTTLESTMQILTQILSLSFLRIIMVGIMLHFQKTIKDTREDKKKEEKFD